MTHVYQGNIELPMIFQLLSVVIVPLVGCLIPVAPIVNPAERVRLVTTPVKNAKIVLSVNIVRAKQKTTMRLILPNAVIVQPVGRLISGAPNAIHVFQANIKMKKENRRVKPV